MIIFKFLFLPSLFETRAGSNRRRRPHRELGSLFLHRIRTTTTTSLAVFVQPLLSFFLLFYPYPGCTMQIWVTFSSSTDVQIAGTLSKPLYCGFRYVVVPLSNRRDARLLSHTVHPVIRVHWHYPTPFRVCEIVKHSAMMWEFINAPLMHYPHNEQFSEIFIFIFFKWLMFFYFYRLFFIALLSLIVVKFSFVDAEFLPRPDCRRLCSAAVWPPPESHLRSQ